MDEKLHKRNRAVRGESLVEVLAAIVISGLAILMLATTIAASVRVNLTSGDAMNKYYIASNDLALGNDSELAVYKSESDAKAESVDGNVVLHESNAEGNAVYLNPKAVADSNANVGVKIAYRSDIGGVTVAAYEEK